MQLILASASPRRQELLKVFGIPFTVRAADIDETMNAKLPPEQEVARVSRLKALAVPREEGDAVVAADTIVVCRGQILGKPRDEADAVRMLKLLSGGAHQVMTGCTVVKGSSSETFTEITTLHFRPLTDREIARYVASGEPMDKAGAYGVQGLGALLVERIDGDFFNVMGLPVLLLSRMLAEFGVTLL